MGSGLLQSSLLKLCLPLIKAGISYCRRIDGILAGNERMAISHDNRCDLPQHESSVDAGVIIARLNKFAVIRRGPKHVVDTAFNNYRHCESGITRTD